MKLSKLVLRNFRGFERLDLEFHPEVTIIAGINGSGKTSVLDAIRHLLVPIFNNKSRSAVQKSDTRIGQQSGEIALEVEFDGETFSSREALSSGNWKQGDTSGLSLSSDLRNLGPLPIWVCYQVNRHASDLTPGSTNPGEWPAHKALDSSKGVIGFAEFFHWFREREDLENEVRRDQSDYIDGQLSAVRRALELLLPGYSEPRVRRPRFGDEQPSGVAANKPVLVISKDGRELAFDQLSEGERTTSALVCDIARRLSIANPSGDPLKGEGIVMIDEIDLHLHPQWQVQIVPLLRRTFPNLQLIATTHSPLVLSYIESKSVRLLSDFRLVDQVPLTFGRDPNAVLTDLFDVPLRPDDIDREFRNVAELIDNEQFREAREALDALRVRLGSDDREIVRLNAMIEFMCD